jgi:Flp pilus assembly protein TadB
VKKLLEDINNSRKQRSIWIRLSYAFIVFLTIITVNWSAIIETHNIILWISIFAVLIVTAAFWWYWTVDLVRKLLNHKEEEFKIIESIVYDLQHIKKDVDELKKSNK